jgi:hypothetical protein
MTGDTADEIRAQWAGQAMSCQCRSFGQPGGVIDSSARIGVKSQNLDRIIMILNRH